MSQAMRAEFATKKKDIDGWIAVANKTLKDAGLPDDVRAGRERISTSSPGT